VDGSATTCFDPTQVPSLISNETPAAWSTFECYLYIGQYGFSDNSVQLYMNGVLLQAGVDYNLQSDSQTILLCPRLFRSPAIFCWRITRTTLRRIYRPTPRHRSNCLPIWLPLGAVLCSATGPAQQFQRGFGGKLRHSSQCARRRRSCGGTVRSRASSTVNGFTFSVLWGGTAMVQRTAASAETMVAGTEMRPSVRERESRHTNVGRCIAVPGGSSNGVRLSRVRTTISFRAGMSAAGSDSVALENYTVLRYRHTKRIAPNSVRRTIFFSWSVVGAERLLTHPDQ